MAWKKYLAEQEIQQVCDVMVDEDLMTAKIISLLLQSIPKYYTDTLDYNSRSSDHDRLKLLLDQLNEVQNLKSGEIPLEIFLTELIDVTASGANLIKLEGALAKIAINDDLGSSDVRALNKTSSTDALETLAAPLRAIASDPLDRSNTEISTEAMIGGMDDTLSAEFLRHGAEAAKSICKLSIFRFFDGEQEFGAGDEPVVSSGTGWVIAPGLVITNYHVINARRKVEPDAAEQDFQRQAETACCLFDYFEQSEEIGDVMGSNPIVAANQKLDFVILKLPPSASQRPPLKLRQHAIRKRPIQALGTRVNVLQHPSGRPMRLGFRNNFVVYGDNDLTAYLTDTARGSSGAPVFDDSWNVAALHFGSRSISDRNIKLQNKIIRRENTGVPIPTIRRFLETEHPEVAAQL